jgi:hypothetical protein
MSVYATDTVVFPGRLRDESFALDVDEQRTEQVEVGEGHDLASFALKILDGASPAAFTVALEGVLRGGERVPVAVPASGSTKVAGFAPASPTISAPGATSAVTLDDDGCVMHIDVRAFERLYARTTSKSSTAGAKAMVLISTYPSRGVASRAAS